MHVCPENIKSCCDKNNFEYIDWLTSDCTLLHVGNVVIHMKIGLNDKLSNNRAMAEGEMYSPRNSMNIKHINNK